MNQAINTCITGLNNVGQGFWDYAAGIFIQAGVLIALLLSIDFLLRKRVRAVFRYCLWMLVFIKLVLPASFTLPTGIGYWLGDYFTSKVSIAKWVPQIEETAPIAIYMPQGYIPSEATIMNETASTGIELEPIRWQGLVFLGWLVGMLVLLVLLVKRVCFVRGLIAQSRPANERSLDILNEGRSQIGIRQNIELRLSGNTLSPVVCGLFNPIILIPAALLKKLSREKLKTVLIHELAHIKRGDVWVNLLQTMLQIVYFYNPFVWLANAMVRRVREQAVDEMVLVTLKPETKNYSNMLIDIAEMAFWRPKFSVRLISVVESKKALERRIKHMLNRPVPKSSKLGFLGLFAIIVIGAIILPMGCNPAGQTTLDTPVKDGRIVDKIDYPFINDSQIIGTWKSVDFVGEMKQFKVGEKQWKGRGGELYLKELIFLPNGRTFKPWWTWTKGLIFHSGDKTAAKYHITEINGSTYMFFQWKSGDYTIRHRKPSYYVLKKISSETAGLAEARASLASITPVIGTTKPLKQKAETARFLRVEVSEECSNEESEEDLDNSVYLVIPLADLKAGNTQLPTIAKNKMDAYGITLEGIVEMIENGVAPMIVLEWEEKIRTKSEEVNTHVKISLE